MSMTDQTDHDKHNYTVSGQVTSTQVNMCNNPNIIVRQPPDTYNTPSGSNVSTLKQLTESHYITTEECVVNYPMVRPRREFLDILKQVGASWEVLTRKEVCSFLKDYIGSRQLYNPNDPSIVFCKKDPLGKVFGVDKFTFTEATKLIDANCYQLPDSCMVKKEQLVARPKKRSNTSTSNQERRIVTVSCPKLIDILVHSPSTQTTEQQKAQNNSQGQSSDTSANRVKQAQNLPAASTGRRRHRWVSEREDSEPDIIAIELDADNDDDVIGVEVGTNGADDVISVEVDADRISFEYEVCSDEDDIISSTASVSGISDTNVVIICGDSDMEFWGDSDSSDSELSDGDKWTCTECDTKNSPLHGHCGHCKKVRPNWLPETTRKRRLERMNSKDQALLSSSECSDISHIPSKFRRSSRDRLTSIELESDKDLIVDEEDSGISTVSSQQSSQENLADNKLKSYSTLIENSSTLGTYRTLLNFQSTDSAKNKDELSVSDKMDISGKLQKESKQQKSDKISNNKELGNSQSQLGQCCICFSRPKTASIIHGCTGHQVCCYRCAKRLKRLAKPCPLCRRPIQKVIKNYFA
ncbi:E3 ubiquitin-protein ligase Mdm2-like [Mytilus californianus]|uniref:E3 ubiquitin-protein ligase Mdm2-like n=1 Tax=Mytilus californianus TaxID=6549 RepID=UPI0022476F4A|nr:E3 ubiquitin-protein ligase Mdm2-like [Mytilus californianus]